MANVKRSNPSFKMLGYELPAVSFEPEGADMGFVLWLYGRNSNKEKHEPMLEKLARELNLPVFCFDYSGHGAAPFEFSKITPAQHFLEVITVYDDICARYGCGGGAVIGGSYGSFMLLQLLKYRQIKAGILRAPALLRASSFYTRWEYIDRPSNLHWQNEGDALAEHPLLARANENKAPILVVEHENDQEIPAILPRTLHERLSLSDYVVAEGMEHSLSSASDEQKQVYEDTLIDWLKKHI